MILSAKTIKEAISSGKWTVNVDINTLHFGPNSVDVSLSKNILEPRKTSRAIDPTMDQSTEELYILKSRKEFLFRPKDFILGSVNEKFDCSAPIIVDDKLRYFAPMYEGRSTAARLGIQSHISAAFGDYGFKGSFTLELLNNGDFSILMKENMRIGQVYFIEVDSGVLDNPYKGYDQTDCLPSAPILGKGRF